MVITKHHADAEDVRNALRRHLGRVWFTERRVWWLWVRFTVCGTPDAMRALQRDLDRVDCEQGIQDAW